MKQNTFKLWMLATMILAITPQIIQTSSCPITQDCCNACNDLPCSQSKNYFNFRPFSSDASREITLEKTVFQTESNRDEWNGCFSFATQYMQSFNLKGGYCGSCCTNLGSMPFWGASQSNSMTIGINNGEADLDAFNFGLGNVEVNDDGTPKATITLNPKISQAGTDFMLYFVHKKEERGMYFKVHAPLAAMMMNHNLCEIGTVLNDANDGNFSMTTTDTTEITYSTAYPNIVDRYFDMSSAFAGGYGQDKNTLGGQPTQQILLQKGKIAPCKLTEIWFADISVVLGYNIVASEKGFLGIGFKATCPTGNVPTGEYMLEPIVGRGGLWGVGGDVMGHYKAWKNDEETKYLDVWFQGDILHLMPGVRPSMRSFDLLANGKGSKYLLTQAFMTMPDGTVQAQALTQAINFTTLPVLSKFAVEGSFALMFDYHCHDWNFALSGEFWGRTKECLAIDTCSAIAMGARSLNNYAVVGRQASTFEVMTTTGTGTGVVAGVIPLCEPAATINESLDTVTLVGGSEALPTFPTTYPEGIVSALDSANRIPADLTEALDICGAAAARAFTGKVFAQLGYTWNDCRYTPNISIIGGAEFSGKTNNSISQWNAGVQGSINF